MSSEDTTRTFRMSTSTLGEGYVECVSDSTLLAIEMHSRDIAGTAFPEVAVLEAMQPRRWPVWMEMPAPQSVVVASDAYPTKGPSPLFPDENTSQGQFVGFGTAYDPLPEPEDDGIDVQGIRHFMRSTKAPPRWARSRPMRTSVKKSFNQIGCNICHVSSIVTAAAGTPINGGASSFPTLWAAEPSIPQRLLVARYRHR